METLENSNNISLNVFSIIVIIILTVIVTLLVANYFKFSSVQTTQQRTAQEQECDCSSQIIPSVSQQQAVQPVVQSPTTIQQPISQQPVQSTVQSTIQTTQPIVQPTIQSTVQSTVQPTVQTTNANNKYTLVFYYMPGCGHCRQFVPEWDKVKNSVLNSDLKLFINLEEVNSNENPSRCSRDGIRGFPTIILIKPDGSRVLYNDYPRTYKSVMAFIQENSE